MNRKDDYTLFSYQLMKQENMKELLESADKFFEQVNRQKIKPVNKFMELFDDNFILSDASHGMTSPKQFIIENIYALKKLGYTTLFMEHLFYDYQEALDNYCLNPETKLDPQLEQLITKLDSDYADVHKMTGGDPDTWNKYNYMAVIKAAKEAGLRVVAIDTSFEYLQQEKDRNYYGESASRVKLMNYTAYHIINHTMQGETKQKWFAFMGCAHTKENKKISGMSELTGARSFLITEKSNKNHLHIQFNINVNPVGNWRDVYLLPDNNDYSKDDDFLKILEKLKVSEDDIHEQFFMTKNPPRLLYFKKADIFPTYFDLSTYFKRSGLIDQIKNEVPPIRLDLTNQQSELLEKEIENAGGPRQERQLPDQIIYSEVYLESDGKKNLNLDDIANLDPSITMNNITIPISQISDPLRLKTTTPTTSQAQQPLQQRTTKSSHFSVFSTTTNKNTISLEYAKVKLTDKIPGLSEISNDISGNIQLIFETENLVNDQMQRWKGIEGIRQAFSPKNCITISQECNSVILDKLLQTCESSLNDIKKTIDYPNKKEQAREQARLARENAALKIQLRQNKK